MYVRVCVCVWVCYHDKTKTTDRIDLKLGTVVVLDILSKPLDFRVTVRVGQSAQIYISIPSSSERQHGMYLVCSTLAVTNCAGGRHNMSPPHAS